MWVVELLFLLYFVYVVSYTGVFSVAALFYRKLKGPPAFPKFCVLIPAYKEDSVIVDTARSNLNQNYPADRFEVVVIADSLQDITLDKLRQLPIRVVPVSFESSTKVKALSAAMTTLPDHYDYAIILDADNVAAPDFLAHMAAALSAGSMAVQGQRKPKNTSNYLSLLDGVSEAINNHIYRQGTVSLGLSSSISGSGVAFNYPLLKSKIGSMASIGGFDRELELLLIKDNIKVQYHKDAIVYDEKVSQSKAFQNQRKRWISSQFHYLRKYFFTGCVALLKGNITFFNSAVLRNIQLPRLINIGLLTLLTLTSFLIRDMLYFGHIIWLSLFAANTVAILIAIPKEFYSKNLLIAVLQLPLIFINMTLLLFRLRGANKKFIHTPHLYPGLKSGKE